MIKLIILLCIYLFSPVLIIYLYQRFPFCKKIGTIIMAYALGIILALSGFMDIESPDSVRILSMQNILQTLCVPIAIPLMLFSSNIKLWFRSLNKTLVAFATGTFAILVAVMAAYFVFKPYGISELGKAAGLMVGFYTGGTPNVASLNVALKPSPETFILVNSFQIIVNFIFILFIILGGYKLIRKILPYKNQEKEIYFANTDADSFENYKDIVSIQSLKQLFPAMLLSLLIFMIGGALSLLFPKDYRIVVVVLSITSFAIIATFIEKIRNTPRTFELGMYFILIFSVLIASNFRIDKINQDTIALLGFIAFIMVVGVSIHLLLSKIFKIEGDLYTIAITALLFSPPFVPTVAGAMNNKKIIISGIVIGLLGYAVGNYLGIGVYELCKWLN